MPLASPDLPAQQSLDYATLLTKHGYSAAGYAAAVQEAVDSVLAGARPAGRRLPAREVVADEVQTQLFHVVLTRLAPPTMLLESLQAFFTAGGPLVASEVTLHLLASLGPLHQLSFYHPQTSCLPAQVL